MFDKAKQYFEERKKWLKHKRPYRTPERMEELFAICSGCEHFKPSKEGVGSCGICGCNIKKEGAGLNKLAWATTQCPDEPPRWEVDTDLPDIDTVHAKAVDEAHSKEEAELEGRTKEEITTPPPAKKKKKGGCGCGGK